MPENIQKNIRMDTTNISDDRYTIISIILNQKLSLKGTGKK